ncbi:sugar (and other) transporter family protein [Bordetella holmesii 35009]|nr:sugar (and other) transporter family protein [Bordetella holmesii 35009]
MVVMIGMLFVQPVVGFMSDKVGRRPFLLIGSIGVLVLAIPSFGMIASDNIGLIFGSSRNSVEPCLIAVTLDP